MDRKLGELVTKNWGMRKEDSSVYALWWQEGRVSPESDLIEGGNENGKRRDIRAAF